MTEREERLFIAACVAVERWEEQRAMPPFCLWREFEARSAAFNTAMLVLKLETQAVLYAEQEAGQ